MNERKKLVLDLDETLIHAHENLTDYDFEIFHYKVKKRPYLDKFIERALEIFDVSVWTSSSADYASAVVAEIFPSDSLELVWARNRCTRTYIESTGVFEWTKPLHKLTRAGFDRKKIIAVDDTAAKWFRSYGNYVPVREFIDDPNDTELAKLIIYLEKLNQLDDVTHIDKRKWRSEITSSSDNLGDLWRAIKKQREEMGEEAWHKMRRQNFIDTGVYDWTHPCPLEAMMSTVELPKQSRTLVPRDRWERTI